MDNVSDLKAAIFEAVERWYGSQEWEPLLLSDLGSRLAKLGLRVPGGRPGSLRRFVETELASELAVVSHPDIQAYVAVCPKELYEEVGNKLIERKSKSKRGISASGLPRSLLIAFCSRVPDGKRIGYSLIPPQRFDISDSPFSHPFVEIDEEFRMPGILIPKDVETIDPGTESILRERIERWALRHSVDLVQTFGLNRSNEPCDQAAEQTESYQSSLNEDKPNALSRLLQGIPPHLRSELRIPGDIAQLLLGLR